MSQRLLAFFPLVAVLAGCSHDSGRYAYSARHTTIETDPPGARVYQVAPVTGKMIDLGNSPVRDQPVMVLVNATNLNNPNDRLPELYTQHEMVRVRIFKAGYEVYEGNLTTGETETLAHRIKLEPVKN